LKLEKIENEKRKLHEAMIKEDREKKGILSPKTKVD
jgi:hypothetical protein